MFGKKRAISFDFPDLSGAAAIGLDTETKDPELVERGTSAFRGGGYIAGISVAVPEGDAWYFPMRHARGENLPPEQVLAWAKDNLSRPGQPKVGANLIYDLTWLNVSGVKVSGPFYDVQIAEPLLDDTALSYSLDSLARKYLGVGKEIDEVQDWILEHIPGATPKRARAHLWQTPAELVGKYARADARQPMEIFRKQWAEMSRQGLLPIFEIETKLIDVLLGMKLQGCRVDTSRAEEVQALLDEEVAGLQQQVNDEVGMEVDINNAGGSLVTALEKLGLTVPKTEKGNPSVTTTWLKAQPHEFCKNIIELRLADKVNGTFIHGILDAAVDGRIHGQYHQLRAVDDMFGGKGTVSGRLSSSAPNLQNLPGRNKRMKKLIRSLFIPEDGGYYAKLDYKAVEPRLLHHIAAELAPGAATQRAVDLLRSSPDIDVYQPMLDSLPDVKRDTIKAIFLGKCYGMGKDKLAATLGISVQEAIQVAAAFDNAVPYLKETDRALQRRAQRDGFTQTLLGRRCRFNMWEPRDRKFPSDFPDRRAHVAWLKDNPALPLEEAEKYYANRPTGRFDESGEEIHGKVELQRAFVYKALNRYNQGSSADVIKKAMVDMHEAGVYDVLGFPQNTVHDEMDFSVPGTPEGKEALDEAVRIMETTVQLRVPLRVDVGTGPTWGDVE